MRTILVILALTNLNGGVSATALRLTNWTPKAHIDFSIFRRGRCRCRMRMAFTPLPAHILQWPQQYEGRLILIV
jgi:hypothetical protein